MNPFTIAKLVGAGIVALAIGAVALYIHDLQLNLTAAKADTKAAQADTRTAEADARALFSNIQELDSLYKANERVLTAAKAASDASVSTLKAADKVRQAKAQTLQASITKETDTNAPLRACMLMQLPDSVMRGLP